MEGEVDGELLDAIGDRQARRVLASTDPGPRSAKEIGEQLDLSLPTVYRRLDRLEELDLVTSRTFVAENGNHYEVFECNFDSAVVSLEEGEYDVYVNRTESISDRFSGLWDEFGIR